MRGLLMLYRQKTTKYYKKYNKLKKSEESAIEQLEKKVEAHNNLVERMTIVEQEEKSNEQRIQRLECEKYD